LENDNLNMLKLCWLGNLKLLPKKSQTSNSGYSIYSPEFYTHHTLIFDFIFRFNRFKTRQLLTFLNIYSLDKWLEYYTIYATSGAIFKKDYFLELWKNHKNSVDEGLQLRNALSYINTKNKFKFFGFTNTEFLKTGFLSSASNQNKHYENVNFNAFSFNKIINEAWYNDEFDSMENYPNDLNQNKIDQLLSFANHPEASSSEWKKWVNEFKNQYLTFGCKID
jgi:hypothetical protein